MICNNCKSQNPDGSKFCQTCGKLMQETPVQQPQQPAQQPAQEPAAQEPAAPIQQNSYNYGQPTQPVQPQEPIKPDYNQPILQPQQPQQSVDYNQPQQPQQPVDYNQPTQPQQPVDYNQPVQQQQPVNYNQPVQQPQQPVNYNQPVQQPQQPVNYNQPMQQQAPVDYNQAYNQQRPQQVRVKKPPLNKKQTNMIIMIAAAAVLLIVAICIFASLSGRVDLMKYVEVKYTGVEGKGSASVNLKEDELLSKICEKEKNSSKKMLKMVFVGGIDVTATPNGTLKNGDKIKVKIEVVEESRKLAKVKIKKLKDKEFKVEGLKTIKTIKLPKKAEIKYEGTEKEAKITADFSSAISSIKDKNEREAIKNYCQVELLDEKSGDVLESGSIASGIEYNGDVKNGDKLTIKVYSDNNETLEGKGYFFDEGADTSKYSTTVSDLDGCLSYVSQLTAEDKETIKKFCDPLIIKKAKDNAKLDLHFYGEPDENFVVTKAEPCKYLLLTEKTPDETSECSIVCVYKIDVMAKINDVQTPITYYKGYKIENVKLKDGKVYFGSDEEAEAYYIVTYYKEKATLPWEEAFKLIKDYYKTESIIELQ